MTAIATEAPAREASVLDPHTRALLDGIAAMAPDVPFESIPIEQSRESLRQMWALLDRPEVPVARSDRLVIDGPNGPVPLIVTWPEQAAEEKLPLALFIHGGGFCRGDAEAYHRQCCYFSREAHCITVNVDYRLAPEHPFPVGLQDAHAAWRWMGTEAASLGGDPSRMAVLGDSAGANFATVIALMAREEAVQPVWQGLIYPGVDLRCHTDYPSRRDFDGGYYFLDTDRLFWYFQNYLGDAARAEDWRASPLFAASHEGLPPALVVTAECDLLRDEAALYHKMLKAAGVDSEYRMIPGTVHGIMSFSARVPLALEVQGLVAARLRAALHPPG